VDFRRRRLLQGGLAISTLAAVHPRLGRATDTDPSFNPQPGAWRTFEIVTQIALVAQGGITQAWVPLPSLHADDWIRPLADEWQVSGGRAAALRVGRYDVKLLHIQWPEGDRDVSVRIVSRVATRDRAVDLARPGGPAPLNATDRALFLRPTTLIPTDGIVKQTAHVIVAGAANDEEKARLLYEWVVEHTSRNANTAGCGMGDIASMLTTGHLSGKCADLNALFVGMARACGIPARDLYGIRVAPSRFGYKSLAYFQGAALPGGSLFGPMGLGSGRPFRRTQSGVGGASRQSIARGSQGRGGAQNLVRRMGGQLDRLQRRP